MRKLLFPLCIGLLALSSFSCASPEQRTVNGDSTRDGTQRTSTPQEEERSSRRRFGRDWKKRYSEKSMQRRYNMSKRQLEAAKKEMKKKNPSLTTKATQTPPGMATPTTGQ